MVTLLGAAKATAAEQRTMSDLNETIVRLEDISQLLLNFLDNVSRPFICFV